MASRILASVIAQVSGEPAEAFIRRRILTPLGMTDTFPVLKPGAPDRSRVSSNHAGSTAMWHKYWDHDEPPFVADGGTARSPRRQGRLDRPRVRARTPPATLFVEVETGLIVREDAWLTVKVSGRCRLSDNAVVGRRVIEYSSIRPIAIDATTFAHEPTGASPGEGINREPRS